MTAWLQDRPLELCKRMKRIASAGDLREVTVADEARALMHGAADIIGREVLLLPVNEMNYSRRDTWVSPLHWSWRDRFKDAVSCLTGRARVLRRVE